MSQSSDALVFSNARPPCPDVQTAATPGLVHSISVASDISSARLTPSPHCSPCSSPKQQHLAPDLSAGEASTSQSHGATDDPLGPFRYDPARDPAFPSAWSIAMPNSGGLAPGTASLGTASGSSESRWPFAKRSLAPNPTTPERDHPLQEARDDGANGGPKVSPGRWRPSNQPSQVRALEEKHLQAESWRSRDGPGSAWRPSAKSQSPPAKRDGNRSLSSGQDWRATAGPLRQGSQHRHPQSMSPRTAIENAHKCKRTSFQPMMAVAEPEKRQSKLAAMQLQNPSNYKFSKRYHGAHTEKNASADHLDNSKNCAVWVTNLPGDIEYSELFNTLGSMGRIWCTYINLPDYYKHHTAAAKVVFFKPQAAQKLLATLRDSPISIRGYRMSAKYNRIKYGERATSSNESRVLLVTGKDDFVNPENLRKWFGRRFSFQEDTAFPVLVAGSRAVYEFRFGSYRCQAQMGKMALEMDQPEGFVNVDFGQDPCEKSDNFASSLHIAAQRIQIESDQW